MNPKTLLSGCLVAVLVFPTLVSPVGAEITPVSSTLHILPPLGNDPGDINAFDRSLLRFLKVSACEVIREGTCTPVKSFTSKTGDETSDRIRRLKGRYQIDWKLPFTRSYPRDQLGKQFELRFIVADLELGTIEYKVKKLMAELPIKFRIDNHPIIRRGCCTDRVTRQRRLLRY